MAIYRSVQLSFWTDNKVVDDFTPEDKYFYLYLFTNPQTNMCGCYEVSLTTMSLQTGYTKDTILRLLDRFEKVHEVLVYAHKTKEICLLNWHRYNWQGGNQIPCLQKEIGKIKDDRLRNILIDTFNYRFSENEAPYKPLGNPLQATVTVTDSVTDNDSYSDSIKEIIDYLNKITDSHYTYKNKSNNKHIRARLEEGHTVDDFKTVIDKKYKEWTGTEREQYLRPETLFGNKFEGYLNQKVSTGKTKDKSDWMKMWEDA